MKTARLRGHLLRGLAAMYCYFFSIAHLPLAEAVLLNYSTPLFVPFIAVLGLGEKIFAHLWVAIGIGLAGILLILKPGMALFTPVSLIGVASGMFAAQARVSVRRLTRSEPTLRIVFYFSAVCTAVSAVPLAWRWQAPEPELWVLLVLVGHDGEPGPVPDDACLCPCPGGEGRPVYLFHGGLCRHRRLVILR